MRWLPMLASLVILVGQTQSDSARSEADALKIVQSAFNASHGGLESGVGQGVFRHYERPVGAKEWELKTEADVEVQFDESRYHILLEYSKEPLKLESQTIVYDGSAIFTSRFSERIRPLGSETTVYERSPTSSGMVRPQFAGFRWDVTDLVSSLMNINKLIENVTADGVTFTGSASEGYVGEHRVGRTGVVVFDCPREYGYNVCRRQSFTKGGAVPIRDFVATWRQQANVWFIDSLSEKMSHAGRELRWELEYSSFEVNAEVSPEMFTMDALAMSSGSRFLDKRNDVTEPIHFVPYEADEIESKLGDMVSQLESLPTDWQPADSAKPRRSFGKILIVLVNVIIIAAIVVLVVVRRRRASR